MIDATTKALSDETIRRFLLGSLNAAEQTVLEHSLFVDAALEERVRLAELELSDDYAAHRLNSTDRNLFRQRFLLTSARERQLEVSRALSGTVGHREIPFSFWQQMAGVFDVRQHTWKYAFATLILVLVLLATALLVRKEHPRLVDDSRRPQHSGAPKPSATQSPVRAGHSTNAPALEHKETSPVLPAHEEPATSVVLYAGTTLDSAPTVSISGDVIAIQLKLEQPLAESYDVNLTTTAGESIYSTNALSPGENEMLGFEVPASNLEQGDFQVVLTRINGKSRQAAGTYYFRLR